MKPFSLFRQVSLGVLSAFILTVSTAFAASLTTTPTNMQPGDISTLSAQLTSSATSMTLNPVKKWIAGVRTSGCFNTASGFLLIQDYLGQTEYASFNGKSCSAANVTTLSNLRRGLSATGATFNAGTGIAFDAGASVKVVDYPIIYNYALYKDTYNIMTGSGQFTGNSVNQAFLRFNGITTAQRDAFTNVADGDFIRNTTTGTFQMRLSGAWVDVGDTGTANGSDTVAGKFQRATFAALQTLNGTGSTGALNVLGINHIIRNSSGSVSAWRIPQLNQNGILSSSFISTTNSGVLITKTGTGLTSLTTSTSGAVLMANQNGSWKASTNLGYLVKRTSGIDKISTAAGETNFATTHVIAANTLSTGSVLTFRITGSGYNIGSSVIKRGLKLGSTDLCRSNTWVYVGSNERRWTIDAVMTVQSNGATGKIQTDCTITEPDAGSSSPLSTLSGSTVTINTTTSNTVNVFQWNAQGTGFGWLIQMLAHFYP